MNAVPNIVSRPATPVIDVAVWIGAYPFRHIESSDIDGLIRLADALHIERIIAGTFENVFQENGLDSWRHLWDMLAGQELIELWPVINPSAPGELKRMEKLCSHCTPRGLRLLPNYHSYSLCDTAALEVAGLARQQGMVIQVFQRIIDERQQWILHTPCVHLDDIHGFVSRNADATILLSGVNGPTVPEEMLANAPKVMLDISRMRGPVFAFEKLLKRISPDRLVFGSLYPIQPIEGTLWQVLEADISDAHRRAVLAGNFYRMMDQSRTSAKNS